MEFNRVYVAGPYTKGNVAANVGAAIREADWLLDNGFIPFVPHLIHLWELLSPKPYETWLMMDNAWLPMCNALRRIPGESEGADKEVVLAANLGLPVFYDRESLLLWAYAAKGAK